MSDQYFSRRRKLDGIGGWLILVAIGLIVNPIRNLWFVVSTVAELLQPEVWYSLTAPEGERYHPLWLPVLSFEIGANVIFLAASAVLLYFFFSHKRQFPPLFIGFFLANLLFQVADLYMGNMIPAVREQGNAESSQQLIRTVIACSIWIPYFLVSKRVKATFTH